MKKRLIIIDAILVLILAVLVLFCIFLENDASPESDMTTNKVEETGTNCSAHSFSTVPSTAALETEIPEMNISPEVTLATELPTIVLTEPPENQEPTQVSTEPSNSPDLGEGGLPIIDVGDIFTS